MKKSYNMRSNDLDRDCRARNPLKLKGIRTRLRTLLNKNLTGSFKYRTDFNRRTGIVVIFTKGDYVSFLGQTMDLTEFEGYCVLHQQRLRKQLKIEGYDEDQYTTPWWRR